MRILPEAIRVAGQDQFAKKLAQMHAKFFAGAMSDRTGTWTAEQTGAGPLAARRWEYANREYQKALKAQRLRKMRAVQEAQPPQEI